MNAVEVIELSGVFVAIVGVIIAIWTFKNEIKKQTEESKRQREISQLTFFADYTKRYQEIILHLPEDMNDVTILDDKETKRYLRVYFDLCSEEYFLYKKGHLNEEVWEEWEEGMKSAFRKKAILKYWQERKTSYYKFNAFVETEIILKTLTKK